MQAVEVVRASFEESSASLGTALTGLADEEYLWEPVAGCWTVHDRAVRRAAGADGRGRWVVDYELPEPQPAPLTTIAWKVVHLAACNDVYLDHAYGPAVLTFDLDIPGDAAGGLGWLQRSQAALRAVLAELEDADLDAPLRTNWGETWPAERVWRTLTHHQVHHGAEIAQLRDLYRMRENLGTP